MLVCDKKPIKRFEIKLDKTRKTLKPIFEILTLIWYRPFKVQELHGQSVHVGNLTLKPILYFEYCHFQIKIFEMDA